QASTAVNLVPLPRAMQAIEGSYALSASTAISTAPQLQDSVATVRLLLGPATGFAFAEQPSDGDLRLLHDPSLPNEGYTLRIDTSGIAITAATNAGVHYALQTLRQLLPSQIYSTTLTAQTWLLPAINIEDAPRFTWRGMHLDVGRHFMPVAFVKKYIDLLAMHKMNSFHWHITEDQGWRIEIKQYPKLTEVGSIRAETVVGNTLFADEEDKVFDGTPYGGFYTQQEVKEVVAYAAARHITIVPEIEFPGHAQAAIAAYPELGNTGKQLPVRTDWGISKNTIKPSEETLTFYRNVLTEVMALFPSQYIHIGGDEAPKDQWEESPYAQQRFKELGLADAQELQSWLIRQMDEFLTANGRRLVGWDEIMQGGLSSNATVMSWRGMKRGLSAAEAGHDVVMAPTRWTYFDYYQAPRENEPLAIGSYLPLRDVYAFEPAPAALAPDIRKRILGAQGQIWTEFMKTPEHVEYMAYPRTSALAEVVWSPREQRDYASFQNRLTAHLERLDALGVNYRPPGNDELGLWASFKQALLNTLASVYFWYSDL
ncbi:MAG: beta-N-acetylhexosaminidase, partial [Halioglobus sp.]